MSPSGVFVCLWATRFYGADIGTPILRFTRWGFEESAAPMAAALWLTRFRSSGDRVPDFWQIRSVGAPRGAFTRRGCTTATWDGYFSRLCFSHMIPDALNRVFTPLVTACSQVGFKCHKLRLHVSLPPLLRRVCCSFDAGFFPRRLGLLSVRCRRGR